jgi:ubiquinone/menaquinone biosynthesis C-methylase UbiE
LRDANSRDRDVIGTSASAGLAATGDRSVQHEDHVRLIEAGIARGEGGVWADLGAGAGAFTLALRDLAGPAVEIVAVDRELESLYALRDAMERRFPATDLCLLVADIGDELALPPLDGLLAANALHYARDQASLLRRWRRYLQPDGRLILVEYDADVGNRWVPYPVSFSAFRTLARASGFGEPVRLGSVPSRFLGSMYAALARPAPD